MSKRSALVVAPGRGTYNKDELGYLHRWHSDKFELLATFDQQRREQGQESLLELDAAKRFSSARFTRGDNASGLIYACAYGDFLSIDGEEFDIAAMTGNSMGWYIALACAGAVSGEDGFRIVNTMGTLMHEALIGGQLLYPIVDDDWREIRGKRAELLAMTETVSELYLSIALGGMLVFGGSREALAAAEERLEPVGGRFPMRLANHAAFHTPLQAPVSHLGRRRLKPDLFRQPRRPLIDGRGHIWYPGVCDTAALHDYTLRHQVVEAYDLTTAIINGVREFAPDVIIILGPGSTLGGAVAQALIQTEWRGLTSKQHFVDRQATDPLLLSMGIEEQRALVL
ncbi:MAG: ACP S-malonyltransferase [Pseudomonadota bacterium]